MNGCRSHSAGGRSGDARGRSKLSAIAELEAPASNAVVKRVAAASASLNRGSSVVTGAVITGSFRAAPLAHRAGVRRIFEGGSSLPGAGDMLVVVAGLGDERFEGREMRVPCCGVEAAVFCEKSLQFVKKIDAPTSVGLSHHLLAGDIDVDG